MELSQEFLIDMAINAGGYLFAGIISIIFYAMMTKKKVSPVFEEVISETQKTTQSMEQPHATNSSPERKVEFIAFGHEQTEPAVIQKNQETVNSSEANGRMNRREVINLVKKMLLAGATHDKIKRILPVSESELALLSLNNK